MYAGTSDFNKNLELFYRNFISLPYSYRININMDTNDAKNTEKIEEMQSSDERFPFLLRHINDPPKKLFLRGSWPPLRADGSALDVQTKYLCIVGSRQHTQYGKQACEELISGLAGYNICIVSGLALGIDGIAHEAALRARLPNIAFPGSGLAPDVVYPARHQNLAERILKAGGALLSEYEPDVRAAPWCFPQRNRLMAGISHATLVIEASMKSGTLITSSLATEYNRDVLALPGSIFSTLSEGPHMLISKGAAIIRSSKDILDALGIEARDTDTIQETLTLEDKKVLDTLVEPLPKTVLVDRLIQNESMHVRDIQIQLSLMELSGLILEESGRIRRAKKYP